MITCSFRCPTNNSEWSTVVKRLSFLEKMDSKLTLPHSTIRDMMSSTNILASALEKSWRTINWCPHTKSLTKTAKCLELQVHQTAIINNSRQTWMDLFRLKHMIMSSLMNCQWFNAIFCLPSLITWKSSSANRKTKLTPNSPSMPQTDSKLKNKTRSNNTWKTS